MIKMIHLSLVLLGIVWPILASDELCKAGVPKEHFTDDPPENCPTCSCASSTNVEFYDPLKAEACCGAGEAVYRVKFTGTWTSTCQSDYYSGSARWSPMTGVSHDSTYELWNACMNNVSEGVASLSQTGSVTTVQDEYTAQGNSIKDVILGSSIYGDSFALDQFSVDSSHPYVSVLKMITASEDAVIGVAGLKLCDGDSWMNYVKVCAELFSIATRTAREAPRNSVQFNHCSFGYFEFQIIQTSSTTNSNSCVCQPRVPDSCPRKTDVESSICCCDSSDNVRFYQPNGPNPVCSATGEPEYRVRFKSTWTEEAHPDYYFPTAHWSPLTGVSHDPSYEVWNGCMFNVSQGVALVSQFGSVDTIETEYAAQGDLVKDTILGKEVQRNHETISKFYVNSTHNYVSVLTMLAPSVDQMAGVNRLDLCDGDGWKPYVKVCAELFSTATKSERVGILNTIQLNNCSFGYFEFKKFYHTNFQLSDFTEAFCSYLDFIITVQMKAVHRISDHPIYTDHYNFTAKHVKTYRNRGPQPLKQTINLLLPDIPQAVVSKTNKLRSKLVLIMGYYDSESNLVVSGNAYFEVYSSVSKHKAIACGRLN